MNQLIYGKEAREKIKNGLDKLANMVKETYGAKGRNVILSRPMMLPYITKDGATVAREISVGDPIENIGVFLGKQIATSSEDKAGDGSTTATVLAQAIIGEAFNSMSEGHNEVYIKRGIDLACKEVVKEIQKLSKKSNTIKTLKSIATISANGDKEIGGLIANVYHKVGVDAQIKVEESNSSETFIDTVKGYTIDNGYNHHGFINNDATGQVEFKDSYIFLYDGYIESVSELTKVFELITDKQTNTLKKGLVILSDNIDTHLLVKLTGLVGMGNNIVSIKSPAYGTRRQDVMKDISILLGCTIYNKSNIDSITVEGLGEVSSVLVDANRTLITSSRDTTAEVAERISTLKKSKQKEASKKDKEFIDERIAKLVGGVALIKVGGNSPVEVKEKIDRVVDALHATRACLEEGYVSGGGTTYVKAKFALDKVKSDDKSIQEGINIVRRALDHPFKQILKNAGIPSEEYLKMVEDSEYGHGFNVDTEEFVNLLNIGIIDPTKVNRIALEGACSVVSTFLSTGGIVYNDEEIMANAARV